jgi:hypothetical protein
MVLFQLYGLYTLDIREEDFEDHNVEENTQEEEINTQEGEIEINDGREIMVRRTARIIQQSTRLHYYITYEMSKVNKVLYLI